MAFILRTKHLVIVITQMYHQLPSYQTAGSSESMGQHVNECGKSQHLTGIFAETGLSINSPIKPPCIP